MQLSINIKLNTLKNLIIVVDFLIIYESNKIYVYYLTICPIIS